MESRVWDRVGAATGIVFVLLLLTALSFELPDLPDPGLADAELIVAFVNEQRSRLGMIAVLYALAWTAFLWFLGSLRSSLAKVETPQRLSSIAFGGGLVTAGLFLAFAGLQLEIVFADFTTRQDVAVVSRWVLFDAAGGLFGITPFPRAVLLGSASLAILRFGGFPRWLGWLGLVAAVLNLLGGFDFLAPAGVTFTGHSLADLFAFLIWVLLASGTLVSARTQTG